MGAEVEGMSSTPRVLIAGLTGRVLTGFGRTKEDTEKYTKDGYVGEV